MHGGLGIWVGGGCGVPPPRPSPAGRYGIHTSRACNEECALALSKAPLPSRGRAGGRQRRP
ncbi:hypothetical protein [Azospirillum doebereinerae]